MLTGFFLHLKQFKLPVGTREYLTLLEALQARVVSLSIDDFYALARLTLVKDEQHYDRFDLAFASYFKGVEAIFDVRTGIPEDWLRREFERVLTDEQKRKIEALGGWDKLMETFRQRLEEQRGLHSGMLCGRKRNGPGKPGRLTRSTAGSTRLRGPPACDRTVTRCRSRFVRSISDGSGYLRSPWIRSP